MAARRIGKLYIELDLDKSRYMRSQQTLVKEAKSGAKILEQNFQRLGIKSGATFDLMRAQAKQSFEAIKRSSKVTTEDIIKAEKAKAVKIKQINEQQYGRHKSMLTKMSSHWKAYAIAATAAIYAIQRAFRAPEEEFTKFETALIAMGRVTDREFSKMREDIMSLPKNLGSATELMQGYYQVISAEVKGTATQLAFLATASKTAKIAHVEQGLVVKGLTSIVDAYEGQVRSAAEAAELLFTIEKFGKTTVAELIPEIGKLTTLSHALAISQYELGGALAQITKFAGTTSDAATQYRSVLTGLMKTTPQMTKLLEEYGGAQKAIAKIGFVGVMKKIAEATGGSRKALSDLLGRKEAMLGFLALMKGDFQGVTEKIRMMEEESVKLDEKWGEWEKTWEAIKDTFDNTIKDFMIEFITDLAPDMKEGLEGISVWMTENKDGIITGFREISKSIKTVGKSLTYTIEQLKAMTFMIDILNSAGNLLGIVNLFEKWAAAVVKIASPLTQIGKALNQLKEDEQVFTDAVMGVNRLNAAVTKANEILADRIKLMADQAKAEDEYDPWYETLVKGLEDDPWGVIEITEKTMATLRRLAIEWEKIGDARFAGIANLRELDLFDEEEYAKEMVKIAKEYMKEVTKAVKALAAEIKDLNEEVESGLYSGDWEMLGEQLFQGYKYAAQNIEMTWEEMNAAIAADSKKTTKETTEEVWTLWDEALNRVQESLADTFYDEFKITLDDSLSIFEGFLNSMLRLISEKMASVVLFELFGVASGAGGGPTGTGGGGGLGSLWDWLGIAKSGYEMYTGESLIGSLYSSVFGPNYAAIGQGGYFGGMGPAGAPSYWATGGTMFGTGVGAGAGGLYGGLGAAGMMQGTTGAAGGGMAMSGAAAAGVAAAAVAAVMAFIMVSMNLVDKSGGPTKLMTETQLGRSRDPNRLLSGIMTKSFISGGGWNEEEAIRINVKIAGMLADTMDMYNVMFANLSDASKDALELVFDTLDLDKMEVWAEHVADEGQAFWATIVRIFEQGVKGYIVLSDIADTTIPEAFQDVFGEYFEEYIEEALIGIKGKDVFGFMTDEIQEAIEGLTLDSFLSNIQGFTDIFTEHVFNLEMAGRVWESLSAFVGRATDEVTAYEVAAAKAQIQVSAYVQKMAQFGVELTEEEIVERAKKVLKALTEGIDDLEAAVRPLGQMGQLLAALNGQFDAYLALLEKYGVDLAKVIELEAMRFEATERLLNEYKIMLGLFGEDYAKNLRLDEISERYKQFGLTHEQMITAFTNMSLEQLREIADLLGIDWTDIADDIGWLVAILKEMGDVANEAVLNFAALRDQITTMLSAISSGFGGGVTAGALMTQITGLQSIAMAEQTGANLLAMSEKLVQWYSAAVAEAEAVVREEQVVANLLLQVADRISGLVSQINQTIRNIKYSPLNVSLPGQKAAAAQEDYATLLAAAQTGGTAEIQKYLGFTQTYLRQQQADLKSSQAYQDIYATVMADMEAIKAKAEAGGYDAQILAELTRGNEDIHADLSGIQATFSEFESWILNALQTLEDINMIININWENWTGDQTEALRMLLQLVEVYGWDHEYTLKFLAEVPMDIFENLNELAAAAGWIADVSGGWNSTATISFLKNIAANWEFENIDEILGAIGWVKDQAGGWKAEATLSFIAGLMDRYDVPIDDIEDWLERMGVTDDVIRREMEIELIFRLVKTGNIDIEDLADWGFMKALAAAIAWPDDLEGGINALTSLKSLAQMFGAGDASSTGTWIADNSPMAIARGWTAAAGGAGLEDLFGMFGVSWAKGGVVDQPTFGVFGEAGMEAFIPMPDGYIPVKIINGGSTQQGSERPIDINLTVELDGQPLDIKIKNISSREADNIRVTAARRNLGRRRIY